jgi:prepilin peptidase CpaA
MIPIHLSNLAFCAWAVTVAVCDCRSRRVPNMLVGAGLCAALAASLLHAGPAHLGILHALAAAAVGLAALMPFFVLGMMGAGDVKVFAVLGAWCGLQPLLGFWIVASAVAFAHSLFLIGVARVGVQAITARRESGKAAGLATGARRGLPYAACLTLPALVWLALPSLSGGLQ